MGRIDGKVALISGGARGMGAAHARRLVEEGASVVIGDILDDDGQATAADLGDKAVYVPLDVTKPADWKTAVETAVSSFGGLDILVNNAGIADNFAPIEDFSLEEWDRTIAINLSGAFYGIKAAIPALKTSGHGSIINISSTAGLTGYVERAGYNSAKFGLRGLTKNAALDLGRYNIRSNSIHPGLILTPMVTDNGDDLSQKQVALHRPAEADEVSNLVLFLASDESSFITGAEIAIDGGETSGMTFYES
jgi:3alpha(or 20beta)-hydroxysteroid dehydrogenase